MNLALFATLIYGLLSAAGGLWGYLKSRSKPSLVAGCLSGIILLLAGVLQSQGDSSGLLISRIVVLILVAVFSVRLVRTGKFMPAGIMLIAGVITLSCLFV